MTRDELKAEIDSGGYTGSDAEIAESLNAPTETLLWRRAVAMGEVYAAVEWVAEYVPLAEDLKRGFAQLTSTDTLDTSSPRIQAALIAIFGEQSQTAANLIATMQRPASRAEVLWGEGARVTHLQVADAIRGGN